MGLRPPKLAQASFQEWPGQVRIVHDDLARKTGLGRFSGYFANLRNFDDGSEIKFDPCLHMFSNPY